MSEQQQVPTLIFSRGTVVIATSPFTVTDNQPTADPTDAPSAHFNWDSRTLQWRARAMDYREIIEDWQKRGVKYEDKAKAYEKLELSLREPIVAREHQKAALAAWREAGLRGVVQLPTGAGKTILAVLAIAGLSRPTLVLVPTIDLVMQWQSILQKYIAGAAIGVLGGGQRDIQPITVSTYDSALILLEQLGNRFGLLVADECHHLPTPQYSAIAMGSIAPFRLGLSATVARSDGGEEAIYSLLGDLVYEGRIDQMQHSVLAPYDVVTIEVALTAEEQAAYNEARELYLGFVRRHRINFSSPTGWSEFLWKCAKMPGGVQALRAHREQRRLAQAASGKINVLWDILQKHSSERLIVFTDDNAMAYRIGHEFLLPVITHQTKLADRTLFLEAFRLGEINVLVTSRVLNEGVDVPDASIGVVVSGSGNVREHVQRLGRILRHRPGKRAKLYELIAEGTSELKVQARRRQHHAYQRPTTIS